MSYGKLAVLGAAVVSAIYAILLAGLYHAGTWMVRQDGSLLEIDWFPLYAAGRLALEGQAAEAYQWPVLHAMQSRLGSGPYGGWLNPPSFFLVLAPLSMLPYVPATLAWLAGTIGIFCAGMWAAARRMGAIALGLAAPASFMCAWQAQNGFLTAGLLGIWLGFLDGRPRVAGVALGLMTYKPHLGILFPLLLAVSGRWVVFWTAAATAAVMAGLSAVVFGSGAWLAFLASLGGNADTYFVQAPIPGAIQPVIQSIYGALRVATGDKGIAAFAHAVVAAGAVLLALRLWVADAPEGARAAAALSAGFLLTPYTFQYDAPALAVAAAFILRERGPGLQRWLAIAAVLLPALSLVTRNGFIVPAAWLLMLVSAMQGQGWARWRRGRAQAA